MDPADRAKALETLLESEEVKKVREGQTWAYVYEGGK